MRLGANVIIATPGRLISHITMGNADLSRVSFFVLDEADRMLDMGFSDDILKIASALPENCQTLLFSATMPPKIEQLAKTLLKDPVLVKLAVSRPADKIRQSAYVCHENQKLGIIRHLFKQNMLQRVIIFVGSKLKVKEINRSLRQMKVNCGEMHSDLDQAERDDVMHRFKSGQLDVLVATDIVARGIDIDDIACVINYDVPHDSEDYVHRIGRTARADRDGVAITLVRGREISDFMQIEKFLGYAVEKTALPEEVGEGPEYKPMSRSAKGGRGSCKGGNDRRRKGKGKDTRQKAEGKAPKQKSSSKEPQEKAENKAVQSGEAKEPANNSSESKRRRRPRKRRGGNASETKTPKTEG